MKAGHEGLLCSGLYGPSAAGHADCVDGVVGSFVEPERKPHAGPNGAGAPEPTVAVHYDPLAVPVKQAYFLHQPQRAGHVGRHSSVVEGKALDLDTARRGLFDQVRDPEANELLVFEETHKDRRAELFQAIQICGEVAIPVVVAPHRLFARRQGDCHPSFEAVFGDNLVDAYGAVS